MDKTAYYEKIKDRLLLMGFEVEPYREISYGFQFNVLYEGKKGLVRVYESKKGQRIDLSQVKDESMLAVLRPILEASASPPAPASPGSPAQPPAPTGPTGPLPASLPAPTGPTGPLLGSPASPPGSPRSPGSPTGDPPELIGTDESGKGDYFGPLVVAGVYVDSKNKMLLDEMGVDDSKKLTDSKIAKLAPKIKELCPHSIIVMGNRKYNELYDKIRNLNKLLAWGHARAIENVLTSVDCGYALSDQFGNPELIKNALMEKGRKIVLMQRPRAEENTAVAAASILARHEFNMKIEEMEEAYGMKFQKGASSMVLETARVFVEKFGVDELINVAKLHFKTTDQIK